MLFFICQIFGADTQLFKPAVYSDMNTAYHAAVHDLTYLQDLGLVKVYENANTCLIASKTDKNFCCAENRSSEPFHFLDQIREVINRAIEANQEIIFTGIGRAGHSIFQLALGLDCKKHQPNQVKIITFPDSQIWNDAQMGTPEQKKAAYQKFEQKNILRFTYDSTISRWSTYGHETIGIPIALLRYETMSFTKLLRHLYSIAVFSIILRYQKHENIKPAIMKTIITPALIYNFFNLINNDYLKNYSLAVWEKVMSDIQFRYGEKMSEQELNTLGTVSSLHSKRGLLSLLPI